jgi:hypothetical protein
LQNALDDLLDVALFVIDWDDDAEGIVHGRVNRKR